VEADKITSSLEKYLKILSQPIRIDILKRLNNCQTSLSYSSLKKESSIRYPNSTNFSFHLKTLKNNHFIESQKNGYIISSFGKRILDGILNLEQDIIEENQTRMIRTSKYSKEPFNMSKIKEYLITEGEMDEILADQIASEVDERIRKARIKYLTAPLMREFINGILLEKGLERFRHKLTRLGTPPYEAFKLFSNPSMNPDTFLQKLGSDVSEQFLLLNLLPKELADSYLSGDIMLLNLNYWSLRPLSIVLDTELVVNYLARKLNLDFTRSLSPGDIIKSLSGFQSCLKLLKPYISGDLVFRDFVNQYLTLILSNEKSESFLFKLSEMIKHYNSSFNDSRSHLTLEFFRLE